MKTLIKLILMIILVFLMGFYSFNCYYAPHFAEEVYEEQVEERPVLIIEDFPLPPPSPQPPIIILPVEPPQPEKPKIIYRDQNEGNSRERQRSEQTNLRDSDSQRSTNSRRN